MANQNTKSPKIPDEYRPISMWGYFGYEILFAIPIIGWIFAIIFAFTASNINLRNFSRSQFCLILIQVILWLVLLCTGLMASLLDVTMR